MMIYGFIKQEHHFQVISRSNFFWGSMFNLGGGDHRHDPMWQCWGFRLPSWIIKVALLFEAQKIQQSEISTCVIPD